MEIRDELENSYDKKKFNRILSLRDRNGEWCSNQDILQSETVSTSKQGNLPNIRFPRLKPSEIKFLEGEITYEEIKRALFDMAPLKAPGRVFSGKPIEQELNNTLIVLIPKKACQEEFSQFRPISLCSVMYTLVMKVIVNRFKLEQAGFITGRNITDNIILAQEVLHSMHSKRNGKNWMAIKLDLEKAYDRVSWEFIRASLEAVGVPEFLKEVIMSVISSSSMQILWNGVPTHKFIPAKGIRQGCPLSPYLFVLYMDWLGHIIKSDIDIGSFVKFWGTKLVLRKVTSTFLKEVQNLGLYLGVLLLHSRVTKSTFSFVVDKVRRKFNSWDARKLSIARRVTLAQSVLLSIPNYFMQSTLIPKGVCAEIKRLVRQFIWSCAEGHPKMSLVGGILFVIHDLEVDLVFVI
ncbi:LINE-1 reverse transcriptase isogeny [Gossypium australe]|uniref:LINE-1 reverse transcriptase isogeny n=1 Tax=Gossypium australe TaxID=47621 RepID=A0A5B6V7W8_9ROSI|nr:LINE-1 reverse transcriptase isogeny [Gossypium australe]